MTWVVKDKDPPPMDEDLRNSADTARAFKLYARNIVFRMADQGRPTTGPVPAEHLRAAAVLAAQELDDVTLGQAVDGALAEHDRTNAPECVPMIVAGGLEMVHRGIAASAEWLEVYETPETLDRMRRMRDGAPPKRFPTWIILVLGAVIGAAAMAYVGAG
jgi:hypothetical protein